MVGEQSTLSVATRASALTRSLLILGQCRDAVVPSAPPVEGAPSAATATGTLALGTLLEARLLLFHTELYTLLFGKEWWGVGSRTPFTPILGYRESGELLTPDHLDNCHSLPVCVETDTEPRWTSPKSLEPHSLI